MPLTERPRSGWPTWVSLRSTHRTRLVDGNPNMPLLYYFLGAARLICNALG